MPIDLSLKRVTQLLKCLGNPHKTSFKSVHVAGTNGKGSTLAYLSSILTQARITNGKFTSPHLITYNDCVTINNKTYPAHKFDKIIDGIRQLDSDMRLGCTEFEILTATAFKIFEIESVELALIEVGVGGRLDATNVLQPYVASSQGNSGGLLVSGITKIAMDHEGLLGSNLKAIAREKAGIIKRGVPVVVDNTNVSEVLEVIEQKAKSENSPVQHGDIEASRIMLKYSPLLGDYQLQNLSVAMGILDVLRQRAGKLRISEENIISGIQKTLWPGRLQRLRDSSTMVDFILDGAHNESAASELDAFLQEYRRKGLIFVIALSQGKSIESFLQKLVRKELDTLIPFAFSQPENMPWVECYEIEDLKSKAKPFVNDIVDRKMSDTDQMFKQLYDMRQNGDMRPIVICGSLYLCSDILRHIDEQKERET